MVCIFLRTCFCCMAQTNRTEMSCTPEMRNEMLHRWRSGCGLTKELELALGEHLCFHLQIEQYINGSARWNHTMKSACGFLFLFSSCQTTLASSGFAGGSCFLGLSIVSSSWFPFCPPVFRTGQLKPCKSRLFLRACSCTQICV